MHYKVSYREVAFDPLLTAAVWNFPNSVTEWLPWLILNNICTASNLAQLSGESLIGGKYCGLLLPLSSCPPPGLARKQRDDICCLGTLRGK